MVAEYLSPLQLLILALAASDANTYELRRDAGLSPGAIAPAVQQLVNAGYLKKSERGHHGKQGLSITRKGKDLLSEQLVLVQRAVRQRDVESILRVAVCIRLVAQDGSDLAFLDDAAQRRNQLAAQREPEIADFELEDPIQRYRWMRFSVQAVQFRAEAEALRSMVEKLQKLRSGTARSASM